MNSCVRCGSEPVFFPGDVCRSCSGPSCSNCRRSRSADGFDGHCSQCWFKHQGPLDSAPLVRLPPIDKALDETDLDCLNVRMDKIAKDMAKLAQGIDEHTKDMQSMKQRIERLEKRFGIT